MTIRNTLQMFALLLFLMVTTNFVIKAIRNHDPENTDPSEDTKDAFMALYKGQVIAMLIRIVAGIGEIFCMLGFHFFK